MLKKILNFNLEEDMVYEERTMLHMNLVDGQLRGLNNEQGEAVDGGDAEHLASVNKSTSLDFAWGNDSDGTDYEVENGDDASSSEVESDCSEPSELYNDLEGYDDNIFADTADYG